GGTRGAWDALADGLRAESRVSQEGLRAGEDRFGVVRRRGKDLAGQRTSVRSHEDEIGEGAAHVDSEPKRHERLLARHLIPPLPSWPRPAGASVPLGGGEGPPVLAAGRSRRP